MIRNLLSTAAIAVMFGAVSATDFCFPSPTNPAGFDPAEIPQYITIMWDDNTYSGLDGTTYEAEPGHIPWSEGNCVGGSDGLKTHGFPQWHPSNNSLNIQEGDMGMAWAMQLGIPTTFNMITGHYVPITIEAGGLDSDSLPKDFPTSPLGHWFPNAADKLAGHGEGQIPVSWGREQRMTRNSEVYRPGCNAIATNMARKMGHEIGNHTLDHLEPDSPLPGGDSEFSHLGFALWENEGYDISHNDTMPWGEVINEAVYLKQLPGQSAQTMGWRIHAGQYISSKAWSGALTLSEEWLLSQTEVKKNELYGFRAPRREVSSNLYRALVDKGYEYDCSLEEGYEEHRTGSNFLWPYTVDNGSHNSWTQFNNGERRTLQSMPVGTGLWEIPLNALIVPEDIRENVWANYEKIALFDMSQSELDEAKPQWIHHGKIPAIDYDMFIKWGITSENWLKTMKNSLELRLTGNKAPLNYNAHSDYYTPTYDFQVLLHEKNYQTKGLCVTHNWNNWETRKHSMEEWISWAKKKGCQFVTGHTLIEEVQKLSHISQSSPNKSHRFEEKFTLNSKADATSYSFSGKANIQISIPAPEYHFNPHDGEVITYPSVPYRAPITDAWFSHISLDYSVFHGALVLRLILDGEHSREVLLNNINSDTLVHSGLIPIEAFDYNSRKELENMTYKPIDPQKIIAIEIEPLAPDFTHDGSKKLRTEPFNVTFSVSDIRFHYHTLPMIESHKKTSYPIDLLSATSKKLDLHIPSEGAYTIVLLNVNGRKIFSYENKQLSAGKHTLPLNNLSKGVYMICITNQGSTASLRRKIIIK